MKHLRQLPDGRFEEQETELLLSHFGVRLSDGRCIELRHRLIDQKEKFSQQERRQEAKTRE